MIRVVLPLALFLLAAASSWSDFDADFTGRTIRLDYYHTGNSTEEWIALDRVRVEGAWPGSRTALIDTTNLGYYFFEIVDLGSQRTLYSRGFSSIFGEWQTTGEARERLRTLPEAIRFPEPRRPVQVRLRKRAPDQSFREIWSTTVDPASRFVDRSPVAPSNVVAIQETGPPATRVDLLLLGDGYTAAELDRYHEDARRLTEDLFTFEPFSRHRGRFNVWAVDTPAAEPGVSRPRSGVYRDSPLGASYNAFDSERYVLSMDDRAWRDAAAAAPYDFVVILVNNRKYGGGGIYRLYATAAAGSSFSPYLFVHEFGHHFAGLGDEYYTSAVAYEDFHGERVEPWEPNITALGDPARLKWADLVEEGTPLPTPWDKPEYEEASRKIQAQRGELRDQGAPEEELEALFERERELFTEMLGTQEHSGKVGAFEGASYEPLGLYRPSADCVMFTRDEVGFCSVCERALERVIEMYSR